MGSIILVSILVVQLFFNNVQSKTMDKVYGLSEDHFDSSAIEKYLSFEYTSKKGKKVYVFDKAIPTSLLMAVRSYFSLNDDWRFTLFDQYAVNASTFDRTNDIPWKSWQNPTVMSGTRVSNILKTMVKFASSNSNQPSDVARERSFQLTEIYSGILRRGDLPRVHRVRNSTSEHSYSAIVYPNLIWRKNSYGELLFYEDDDDFDIFAVISPHCGRTVVWDSSIRFITRPPSISETSGQMVIFAQFDSDPNIVFSRRTYFDSFLSDLAESRKRRFVCTENVDKNPKIDFEKHLVLKKLNKAGHKVAVFDDLFDKADLNALRSYTISYGKYYYDDSLDFSSDNVQWIAGFDVEQFVKSRFWPIIQKVAHNVSGSDAWYPYDVGCNLIRNADHTKFHLDVSSDREIEMTFLLYLSPDWKPEYNGETAFMEMNHDSPDNDYVVEVLPRYGRAVIFDGPFPHSAHPPAPDYLGPRYTFAVKLSVNKVEAIKKTFAEESRHNLGHAIEMYNNFKKNATRYGNMMKVQNVHAYLSSKQVKEMIDTKPKTNTMEEELYSQDEDSMESQIPPGIVDAEFPLNPENMRRIADMIKFYGLDQSVEDSDEDSDDQQMAPTDVDMVHTSNRRIKRWQKTCGNKENCLVNYINLFLEQNLELQKRVSRDLLTLI